MEADQVSFESLKTYVVQIRFNKEDDWVDYAAERSVRRAKLSRDYCLLLHPGNNKENIRMVIRAKTTTITETVIDDSNS